MRFVLMIGVASLFSDFVYEGARSVLGPYLALLGASAAIVGIVTGFGEFVGYGLRLVSGRLVDATRHFWPIAIIGYVLQMTSVPLLALTTSWQGAAVLVILRVEAALIRPHQVRSEQHAEVPVVIAAVAERSPGAPFHAAVGLAGVAGRGDFAQLTPSVTRPLEIVFATSTERNAPTTLRTPAMRTATLGVRAPVAIDVAMAFAVSWKPLVKSNASAVTITTMTIKDRSISPRFESMSERS